MAFNDLTPDDREHAKMENGKNKRPAERLRCETCLYWEDFNGVCFCGASPYCADFTDGDDGCCYWQKKEPVAPADTEVNDNAAD